MNAESVIRVCNETMKQIALLPKLPPKSKGPHEDIQNAMVPIVCIFKKCAFRFKNIIYLKNNNFKYTKKLYTLFGKSSNNANTYIIILICTVWIT